MNLYHLTFKIDGMYGSPKIYADSMKYDNSGCYIFSKLDENSVLRHIAFYPIKHSIIDKIEYNVTEPKHTKP